MGRAEAAAVEGTGPEAQLHLVGFNRVGEVSRPSPNIYLQLPTGYLNVFSQQRAGRNEQQSALTESLEGEQIHPISVVMAHPDLVEEYRQFTNRAWGGEVQPEDLKPMPEADPFYAGMYAILCAGHSRTEGIREVASRAGVNPDHALIEARIFEVKTIEDILSIQINENIHSMPNPNRALRAVAQMYLFQTERDGKPPVIAEFRRTHKVSASTMRDAISYVQLPPYIRALANDGDGGLPISIMKELARARNVIESYAGYLADRDERFTVTAGMESADRRKREADREEAVQRQIKTELICLVNGLHERGAATGKNILAGCTFIKGRAKMLRDHYDEREAADLDMVNELFDDPETLAGRLALYDREVRQYLERILSEDQQKNDRLARRLAVLTGIGVEEEDPGSVVATIEQALTLARTAMPASAEPS